MTSGIETPPRFVPDVWLPETLGRPVFRLAAPPSEWSAVLASEMIELSGDGDAFFYAKLPTADVRACSVLINAGFAVVDTGITLSYSGSEVSAAPAVSVGIAGEEHHAAIVEIAATCFRWSRFHLDPQIAPGVADLIKRRWIENHVQGRRGSALYVAEIGDTVVGFLAVIESIVEGRPVAVIDLMGVATQCNGRGVGTALVRSFVHGWRELASELRVGTQAANIRSLRLYQRCGFRIVESTYTLHAHCRNGRILR